MRKFATFSFVIISFLMMISFQNCSPAAQFSQSGAISGGLEKVYTGDEGAVVATDFNQIIFAVHDQRFDRNNLNKTRLNLDLATGAMSIDKSLSLTGKSAEGSAKICKLDTARLERLEKIVTTSKICHGRDEVKAGEVTCMAIGIPDIQLVNYNTKESVQLSPNICHSGVYLCDGVDQEFRSQLADVLTNLPEGCQ